MANLIIMLATGIVLFLFGMMKLSAKMQGLFTARIRGYIKYAVRRPFYGLLTGMVSTITLQSSSAATVLIIGMVSAGLISFYHSLGMILGADIGTTITVQLVVWKVTDLSPLFIIVGGTLWLTGKTKRASIGEAVFYFGLLFFGLSLTASATAPLRDNPEVIRFLQETRNPLWGLAAGIIITGLIHASAITISIVVILAQHGLISLDNALPVVIGANIGTTVTALMAGAVSSGISGKRSALAHLLFKFSGAIISLILLPLFVELLRTLSNNVGQQIALGHFLFNLLIVAVFIFLLKPFAAEIEKRMPGKDDVLPLWPEHLDESCLTNAQDALGCVNRELARQITLTRRMYFELGNLNEAYQEGKHQNVRYIAWVVENLQREIVKYLRTISAYQLSPGLSHNLFSFTGISDDVSRIGDQILIIANLLQDKAERHLDFSAAAKAEMQEIAELVAKNLHYAVELMETLDSGKSAAVFRIEEEVDAKVKAAKEGHLVRYCEKVCQAEAGPVFVEILIHLERVSDHCQNIGEYIADLK
ncbi:MAG: Na/Pi cotransporter family protein [Syntrophales bacterium LBB04]|nr:Na/Pi cotransporter family protein [Syntrophales bacterium LBB04]